MTNPKQQGQTSAFKDIEDHEKRIFKIEKLKVNPNTENLSYEVLLNERQGGSIETTHVNRKFFSKGGYEILPTTTTGICGGCGDVTLTNMLKHCSCGKALCPRCRRKLFSRYYCKWTCAFLAVFGFIVKGLVRIILRMLEILLKLAMAIIRIPLADIHRG